MQHALCRRPLGSYAGDALHRRGTPIGAHVREYLRGTGQQMAEQHGHAVQIVVLGRHHVGLPDAVPVERRVQQRLQQVAVGEVIGPLPLALEPGRERVVPERLLRVAQLGEARVADHEVAADQGHLQAVVPVPGVPLGGQLLRLGVGVGTGAAELGRPLAGARQFVGVVDFLLDTAHEFGHVHHFVAHAEIALQEAGIDDRSADPHGDAAHRQVGSVLHGRRRHCGADEGENLVAHVAGDGGVVGVLHVATVDSERRHPLLGVRRQHGGQVHRSRPLGAVEAPHRLGQRRVHVHGLCPVAPARGDGEGNADAGAPEVLRTGGRLGCPADAGVRHHTLDRQPAGMAEIVADQGGDALRLPHRDLFERLAHPFAAAVDGGPDADPGERRAQPIGRFGGIPFVSHAGCSPWPSVFADSGRSPCDPL